MATRKLNDPEAIKYCVVLGCKNTGHDLRLWKKSICSIHQKCQSVCGCTFPFTLFPFPSIVKLRRLWLQRLGLPELEISHSTCVCSIHFLEGRPTSRSYFPTLYLQPDLSDDDDNQCNMDMEKPDYLESEDVEPKSEFVEFSYDDINDDDSINHHTFFTKSSKDVLGTNYDVSTTHREENLLTTFSSNEEENAIEIVNFSSGGNIIVPDYNNVLGSQELHGRNPNESASYSFVASNNSEVLNNINNDTNDSDNEVEVVYQSSTSKYMPLASYDPTAQTLQISDPVKYIMECHNRIAQLIADNTKLKSDHKVEITELKTQNALLRKRLQLLNTTMHSKVVSEKQRRFRLVKKQGNSSMVVIQKRTNT